MESEPLNPIPSPARHPQEPAPTGPDATPARSTGQAAWLAFTVSAGVMLLQLVQTRVYGVLFWNHLVYFIISIALLGFGISGTWLATDRDGRWTRRLSTGRAGIWFTGTALLSTLGIGPLNIGLSTESEGLLQVVKLPLAYGLAVFPYFFAGWILGRLFRDHARAMDRLYFADLVGAGLGCLLFLALITPLGAIRLLVLACLAVTLPCLRANDAGDAGEGPVTPLILLVILGTLAWGAPAVESLCIRPEPGKAVSLLFSQLPEGDEVIHDFSEWNAISRIDVRSRRLDPSQRLIFIDGDAWTELRQGTPDQVPPFAPDQEKMIQAATPFLLRPTVDSVLIIGSGGGHEVVNALRASARTVDAVEINPSTVRVVRDVFRDLNRNLFHRPGVTLHNEEGRSFARRATRRYDVISMHAIDTFAAINAGAYVLSENFLYTMEAFRDFMACLAPGGIFCVTRWGSVAETVRLFVLALEASHVRFPGEGDRHLAVTKGAWTTVMLKESAFTGPELETLGKSCQANGVELIFPVTPLATNTPIARICQTYAVRRQQGQQQAFIASFPYNIGPVYDDSPFFFHYERWRNLFNPDFSMEFNDFIRGNWPTLTLWCILGLSTLAVLVFICLPLARMPKAGTGTLPTRTWAVWALYFSCLGLSYIFIEIALMQRFALLLGHPARSLALVLGTLLFGTGLGSLISDRVPPGIFLAGIPLGTLGAAFLYPRLIELALGADLLVRAGVAVALVLPLGILMGMPFPRGIKRLADPAAIPWMWGINGGTTVVGSILAIIFALSTGFTTVLLLAATGYLIAAAAWWAGPRPGHADTGTLPASVEPGP